MISNGQVKSVMMMVYAKQEEEDVVHNLFHCVVHAMYLKLEFARTGGNRLRCFRTEG